MANMATDKDFLRDIDQYRGCLLGFAAGDALGYPVETMTEAQISRVYGAHGITRYHLKGGVAQISASTQMMLLPRQGCWWAPRVGSSEESWGRMRAISAAVIRIG